MAEFAISKWAINCSINTSVFVVKEQGNLLYGLVSSFEGVYQIWFRPFDDKISWNLFSKVTPTPSLFSSHTVYKQIEDADPKRFLPVIPEFDVENERDPVIVSVVAALVARFRREELKDYPHTMEKLKDLAKTEHKTPNQHYVGWHEFRFFFWFINHRQKPPKDVSNYDEIPSDIDEPEDETDEEDVDLDKNYSYNWTDKWDLSQPDEKCNLVVDVGNNVAFNYVCSWATWGRMLFYKVIDEYYE